MREKIKHLAGRIPEFVYEIVFYVFCVVVFMWLVFMPFSPLSSLFVPSAYAVTLYEQPLYGQYITKGTDDDGTASIFDLGTSLSGNLNSFKIKTEGGCGGTILFVRINNWTGFDYTSLGTWSCSDSSGYVTKTISSGGDVTLSPGTNYAILRQIPTGNKIYGTSSGSTAAYYNGSKSYTYGSTLKSFYAVLYDSGGATIPYAIENYTPADSSSVSAVASWVFNATTSYNYTGTDWYTFTSVYSGTESGTASTTSRGSTTGLQLAISNSNTLSPGSYSYYGTITSSSSVIVATSTATDFTVDPSITSSSPYDTETIHSDFTNWEYILNTTAYTATSSDRYTIETIYSLDGGVGLITDSYDTIGGQGTFQYVKSTGILPGTWNVTTTLYNKDDEEIASSAWIFYYDDGSTPSPPDNDLMDDWNIDCSSYTPYATSSVFYAFDVWWITDEWNDAFMCSLENVGLSFLEFLFQPSGNAVGYIKTQFDSMMKKFPFNVWDFVSDNVGDSANDYVRSNSEVTVTLPVYDISVTINPTDFLDDWLGTTTHDDLDEVISNIAYLFTAIFIVEMFFVFFF